MSSLPLGSRDESDEELGGVCSTFPCKREDFSFLEEEGEDGGREEEEDEREEDEEGEKDLLIPERSAGEQRINRWEKRVKHGIKR